jgi:arylformamidase
MRPDWGSLPRCLWSGISFVALDFSDVRVLDQDLGKLADQVRRGIAWVMQNAASLGGDPDRFYIGGHSSVGYLAAVALTTDCSECGLPPDAVNGGLAAPSDSGID